MNIIVMGRRWTDTYGNTYHTAEIGIDGEFVHCTDIEYGYGEQYLFTAFKWLEENGYIKGWFNDKARMVPSRWARENNINLMYSVADVRRKKDL